MESGYDMDLNMRDIARLEKVAAELPAQASPLRHDNALADAPL